MGSEASSSMSNSIYALLSKQAALRQQVDMVANNVANLSTVGFKREGLTFAAHVERLDVPGRTLALAEVRSSHTDLSPGSLERTGNALDLAIDGQGFFAVETPSGVRYTRDGRFATNQLGELVTITGHRVLDEGGSGIGIPAEIAAIGVSANGTITASDGRPLAVLGVHRLPEGAMRREADGLFTADAPPEPADGARVMQGFVEASNVNSIRELSDLIEVQRAYDRGRAMLDAEHQRLMQTIEKLDQER
ncbi:MAG: flagellar basal-body rod protein FlgF [Geminicoccaceae bacterium]